MSRTGNARERARLRWMFPQLRLPDEDGLVITESPGGSKSPKVIAEQRTWSVRGEPRFRDQFGWPHPGDFRGGLPAPREYPR